MSTAASLVVVPKDVVAGVAMEFVRLKNAPGSGVFVVPSHEDTALLLEALVRWASAHKLLSDDSSIDVSSWIE